jgi:hypothetical protein
MMRKKRLTPLPSNKQKRFLQALGHFGPIRLGYLRVDNLLCPKCKKLLISHNEAIRCSS